MKIEELNGKNILIYGYGREGESTLTFLLKYTKPKAIYVCDEKKEPNISIKKNNISVTIITSSAPKDKHDIDIVVRSPSILPHNTTLKALQNKGALITSQTILFLEQFAPKIIGITGTKGKSTTSSLLHHVLEKAKKNTILVGNIGTPMLNYWEEAKKAEYIVCELSSYQLIDITKAPHIAILQNVVPTHLDVHGSMKEYITAKQNITTLQNKNDIFIYPVTSGVPSETARLTKAITIGFNPSDTRFSLKSKLKGEFNRVNIAPSVIIADLVGIPSEVVAGAVASFKPLPHRLETIGVYKGIEFVDDSIGTVVEATIQGMKAMGPRLSTLITGGYENGQDELPLAQAIINSPLKTVILFPTTGKKIRTHLEELGIPKHLQVLDAQSMEEAVKLVYKHTSEGICLLSCAAPSFNMFKNYVDRAEQFALWAKKLDEEEG